VHKRMINDFVGSKVNGRNCHLFKVMHIFLFTFPLLVLSLIISHNSFMPKILCVASLFFMDARELRSISCSVSRHIQVLWKASYAVWWIMHILCSVEVCLADKWLSCLHTTKYFYRGHP
jgi:hypothetical protein